MITITREQARAVRQVFRLALGVSARSRDPVITFLAGADGLTIRGATFNVAIEHRIAAFARKTPWPVPRPIEQPFAPGVLR